MLAHILHNVLRPLVVTFFLKTGISKEFQSPQKGKSHFGTQLDRNEYDLDLCKEIIVFSLDKKAK